MRNSKEKIKEFEEIVSPVIKWINDNGCPHDVVIIDTTSGCFYSGEIGFHTVAFVKN
jgi:hypothetical protein